VHKDDVDCLIDDFTSQEKLLKNKLCGEGQNIRFLMIQRMALRIQVIENGEIESIVSYCF
jgi:hypothetical protein